MSQGTLGDVFQRVCAFGEAIARINATLQAMDARLTDLEARVPWLSDSDAARVARESFIKSMETGMAGLRATADDHGRDLGWLISRVKAIDRAAGAPRPRVAAPVGEVRGVAAPDPAPSRELTPRRDDDTRPSLPDE